jgi:hypothetical protein
MPLPDLLQWMDHVQKSGTLLVQGERYKKSLVIRSGRITSSASSDPNDYLGHFLLRQGRIDEAQLKMAMETQRQTQTMLGKILVMVGAISEADLQAVLVQKAEETVFSIFLWKDGRFEFRDGVVPEAVAVPLDLKISDVLLKGLTWYDELQHIREVFASAQSIPATTEKPIPPGLDGDASFSSRLLALVDGKHTIADICLALHASEFSVSKLLFLMHRRGYVKVITKSQATRKPPRKTLKELMAEARSLLRVGEAHAALMVLEEGRPLCPHDASLQSMIVEARSAFVHQAYREGLKPESVPTLQRPLESLTEETLTPEEVFILTRINGSWDVRSILSVSPLAEPDALLHLKRLKDIGLLSFEVPVGA